MEPVALTGERRPITALFADVVGSTSLAERMDPEEWAELMADATGLMRRVVERYDGRVGQVLGDGILAFFGAPLAHEDDPLRAVRAGLDLIAEMAALERSATLPDGAELRVRVGINTGPVVVRELAGVGEQRDVSALGDAVNVAARLQGEAAPNTVLVTADTYAFVRDAVAARPAGALTLKGKSEPVEAFEVVRWTGAARRRGVEGLRSPMVGRDAELVRMTAALAAVRAGRGRAAVIIGEPGLGKSRLVQELRAAAAQRDGIRWFDARCLSYGQNMPHHLVQSVLRGLLGAGEELADGAGDLHERLDALLGDGANESRRFLDHLLAIELDARDRAQIAQLAPDALQRAYADALASVLRAAAGKPAVLVCEDVHWADEASVGLLTRVLPLVHSLPLLLVLVSRADRDAPGWRLVSAARDEIGDALVELRLTGLDGEQGRTLVANLLEIESLPTETRDYILTRADGNPFFVEEVIRMLIDRGAIRRDGDRWVSTPSVTEVEIPETIHGLLLERIDRLPPDARETLRVASVIGRRFGAGVLTDVLSRRA